METLEPSQPNSIYSHLLWDAFVHQDLLPRDNHELTWHYRYLSEGIKRKSFHSTGTLEWALTQRMKNLICLPFLLQATFGFESKLRILALIKYFIQLRSPLKANLGMYRKVQHVLWIYQLFLYEGQMKNTTSLCGKRSM